MLLELCLSVLVIFGLTQKLRAEVHTVTTGYQYGLTYLPLMVMHEQHLVEKNAAALKLGPLETDWKIFSGPAPINDGLLSGSLSFGAVGTPSLVMLWDKTRKNFWIVYLN